jgi:hypothetical protein
MGRMGHAVRVLASLLLLFAGLAACDPRSNSAATATRPATPLATVRPATPTSTVGLASPVASPGLSASPFAQFPGGGTWISYQSPDGKFSIDYLDSWNLSEEQPSVFFLSPDADALVQVTYQDVGVALSNQQLANIASESLQEQFGPIYLEQGRQLQPDNSYRIDFVLQQDPIIDGQAFVEFQGTTLFLIMFMTPTELIEFYYPTFARMITSYRTF